MRIGFPLIIAGIAVAAAATEARADERRFAYSYEADVLPEGGLEFEQWITARAGREGGDYNKWEFREELEYGITDRLTGALYLNFQDEYFHPNEDDEHEDALEEHEEDELFGEDEEEEEDGGETEKFEFAGISAELKYQLLNPNLDAVGLVAYVEGTIDSDEAELEEKIILSSDLADGLVFAVNVALEQEWEYEGSETEEEGKIDSTMGLAYKFAPNWSAGVELRNLREYHGFSYADEALTAWYLGPNIHYGAATWWATLAAMPQIGIEGDRDLEEAERVNVRLIVGKNF